MEIFLVFFSTFLGASTALLSGYWVQRREAKLAEETAINNLLLDLAGKRAFTAGPRSRWAKGAARRIVGSVDHTRTLIRDTRLKLRPRSPFLGPLREMARASNTFLEEAEYTKNKASSEALDRLALALTHQASALQALSPRRIVGDLPGSYALTYPVGAAPSELAEK